MCKNKMGCQKAIWNDRWKGITKFTSQEINKCGHWVRAPAYILRIVELFSASISKANFQLLQAYFKYIHFTYVVFILCLILCVIVNELYENEILHKSSLWLKTIKHCLTHSCLYYNHHRPKTFHISVTLITQANQ